MNRVGAAFALVNVALVAAATSIAALAFWPIYQDVRFLVLVAGAVILGAAVAGLGTALRWPSFVVVPVAAGVLVVAGVPFAVPDAAAFGVLPTPDGVVDVLGGLVFGWKELLTIVLPVGTYRALLVPAWLLVFAATVVGTTIVLRSRRPELATIPPVVLAIAGAALGATRVPWPAPWALALSAVLLLWLAGLRWRRRRLAIRTLARAADVAPERAAERAFGVRTLLAAAAALAVAGSASVGAAIALPPTGERDVLRTVVAQPFDPREHPSPLSGFRRYLREDRVGDVLFEVAGLPEGSRVRIATLDSYDGVVYAVGSSAVDAASGTFVRIPERVDRSDETGERVTLAVTIRGYSDVWLPTVGALESIRFSDVDLADRFYLNTTTDSGVVLGGLSEGDGYRLDAVLPTAPDDVDVATLTPGDGDAPRIDAVPEELRLFLENQARGITQPGARLLAAVDALRTLGYISHGLDEDEPASRSGHGADRIAELVTAEPMIGDAEQYSVAAALLARQVGFPARVVFGVAPPAGSTVVRGGDVTAWIEVHTAQFGWVAIDPVPEDRPIPDQDADEQDQVARPPSIVPPPPDRPEPPAEQSTPDSTRDDPDSPDPALQALLAILRVAVPALLILGLLLSPFLLVLAAKARRRQLRRTAPTTVERIRGGWDEFADTVTDHGIPVPPAATRSELAEAVGTLPPRVLAAVADRAVFAPEAAQPDDAARVWTAVDELRTSLDLDRTRWERWRARISVRSLGGYDGRRLFRRAGR